jgi:hypothetical protein
MSFTVYKAKRISIPSLKSSSRPVPPASGPALPPPQPQAASAVNQPQSQPQPQPQPITYTIELIDTFFFNCSYIFSASEGDSLSSIQQRCGSFSFPRLLSDCFGDRSVAFVQDGKTVEIGPGMIKLRDLVRRLNVSPLDRIPLQIAFDVIYVLDHKTNNEKPNYIIQSRHIQGCILPSTVPAELLNVDSTLHPTDIQKDLSVDSAVRCHYRLSLYLITNHRQIPHNITFVTKQTAGAWDIADVLNVLEPLEPLSESTRTAAELIAPRLTQSTRIDRPLFLVRAENPLLQRLPSPTQLQLVLRPSGVPLRPWLNSLYRSNSVMVDKNGTILDIKKQLAALHNVPIERLRIRNQDYNLAPSLPNGTPLASLNLRWGTKLSFKIVQETKKTEENEDETAEREDEESEVESMCDSEALMEIGI